MLTRSEVVLFAPAANTPSPLLEHLAGRFAPAIARVWPAPHAPFIHAEAERRHLLCLSFAARRRWTPSGAARLLQAPLRRAIALALRNPPRGLGRALRHLGETAWTAAQYGRLIEVLADGDGVACLNHAARLEPNRVDVIHALTRPLRQVGLGHADLDLSTARLLSEVHAALARRDGVEHADRCAHRWAATLERRDILMRVRQDLIKPISYPPFAATPLLRPLRTRADFAEVAARFDNCLATLGHGGDADCAYYEWLGEPGAVIEIFDDRLFGWRLQQARFKNNVPVTDASRAEITRALESLGVYVGRSNREVYDAIRYARTGRLKLTTVEVAAANKFGGAFDDDYDD